MDRVRAPDRLAPSSKRPDFANDKNGRRQRRVATLRFRSARDAADQLGQVFTPEPIAALLAESLPTASAGLQEIVDLGAGAGALSKAVLARHKGARATLIEIDPSCVETLRTQMPPASIIHHADALSDEWQIAEKVGAVISNPPYGSLTITHDIEQILARSGFAVPLSGNWVRGDVAFVAKAWGLAATGCGLGLIVAAPLIRDEPYKEFRQRLVGGMDGLTVTQLSQFTFQNTEVRAFVLTGLRASCGRRNVLLRKAKIDGTIIDEMAVPFTSAVQNLDIDYHRSLERLGLESLALSDTLGSVGVTITRGSKSLRDFERLGLDAFHTTDFSTSDEVVLQGGCSGYHTAQSGDILISRVGSRCLTRQARVQDGEGLFTDCVYRLTVPPAVRNRVWKTLASTFGEEWRLANATGSCAKHLPLQTLQNMPLLP